MTVKIEKTQENDVEILASLISQSNKDVADLFALNINNAPKHPSFCTPEWVLSDLERGQEYFLFTKDGIAQGCVAFEQADANIAYLNRLSVLPKYRRTGTGSLLVNHILHYAKEKRTASVSIGIIAEHTQLKQWYLKLGFKAGEIKKFKHLPFDVLYMHNDIS